MEDREVIKRFISIFNKSDKESIKGFNKDIISGIIHYNSKDITASLEKTSKYSILKIFSHDEVKTVEVFRLVNKDIILNKPGSWIDSLREVVLSVYTDLTPIEVTKAILESKLN